MAQVDTCQACVKEALTKGKAQHLCHYQMLPGLSTLAGHLSDFQSLSGFQICGTFYLKKYETCAPATHCPSLPGSPVSRGEPPEQVQNLGLD